MGPSMSLKIHFCKGVSSGVCTPVAWNGCRANFIGQRLVPGLLESREVSHVKENIIFTVPGITHTLRGSFLCAHFINVFQISWRGKHQEFSFAGGRSHLVLSASLKTRALF